MAQDGSDRDWAGALIVADALGDLKAIRGFLESVGKKGRRRRRR